MSLRLSICINTKTERHATAYICVSGTQMYDVKGSILGFTWVRSSWLIRVRMHTYQ